MIQNHALLKIALRININIFGHIQTLDVIPVPYTHTLQPLKKLLRMKYSITWLLFTLEYYEITDITQRQEIGLKRL